LICLSQAGQVRRRGIVGQGAGMPGTVFLMEIVPHLTVATEIVLDCGALAEATLNLASAVQVQACESDI
jgi:hypothetical protein